MIVDLIRVGERAVTLAERLGAGEAEAYLSFSTRREVSFDERIDLVNTTNSTGLGVRAVLGKRVGLYASSSIKTKDIERAVRTAIAIARVTPPDPDWITLPTSYGSLSVGKTVDKTIVEAEPALLVEAASQAIDIVKDYDRRVTPVRSALTTSVSYSAVTNSHGCELQRSGTQVSLSLEVKAEEAGKKGLSSEHAYTRNWREIDFETMAVASAERAMKMMDAKPISTGEFSVVWRNDLFARIVEVMFSRTLTADSVQTGRSPWGGRLDEIVASDGFSLSDDGLRLAGVGTREFDDEGMPQRETTLIDRGVLKSYLYDNYTAKKGGVPSTGNARRGYQTAPTPQPNNLILQPGGAKPEDLIRETRKGLYVVEAIGEWLSNPLSGDLSATVTNGFLIEKGELTEPVKGVIVAGNFFDILKGGIDIVADDVRNSGRAYSPSVRTLRMTVAGG